MKKVNFSATMMNGIFEFWLGSELISNVPIRGVKAYHKSKHRHGGVDLYTNQNILSRYSYMFFPKSEVSEFIEYELNVFKVNEAGLSLELDRVILKDKIIESMSECLIDAGSGNKLEIIGYTLYIILPNNKHIIYYDYMEL